MNIEIVLIKKRIESLRKERDEIFSMLDEVNYEEMELLVNAISEMTENIKSLQKEKKELMKNEAF